MSYVLAAFLVIATGAIAVVIWRVELLTRTLHDSVQDAIDQGIKRQDDRIRKQVERAVVQPSDEAPTHTDGIIGQPYRRS